MDSQPCDILELVACLRESARSGDWEKVSQLVALLPLQPMPSTQEGLGEYLRCLREALMTGKASRAYSMETLVRINAVVSFNNTRQEFADSADS
jgi:hypothetical protein